MNGHDAASIFSNLQVSDELDATAHNATRCVALPYEQSRIWIDSSLGTRNTLSTRYRQGFQLVFSPSLRLQRASFPEVFVSPAAHLSHSEKISRRPFDIDASTRKIVVSGDKQFSGTKQFSPLSTLSSRNGFRKCSGKGHCGRLHEGDV